MRSQPRRALRALAIAVIAPAARRPARGGRRPQPRPGPRARSRPTSTPAPPTAPARSATPTARSRTARRQPASGAAARDGPFEISDQAGRILDFTRWYDRDGHVVARLITVTFPDAQFSNPLTGDEVAYIQRDRDMEHFAIPGDLDSGTLASTGSITAVAPGFGAVLVERGRWVVAGDEVLQATGRRDLDDYFSGDEDAIDKLCEALAG